MSDFSIIDTPWSTTKHIDCLKRNGIQLVIRYYNNGNSKKLPEKCLTLPEAQALSAAGLHIAVVFQIAQNKVTDFTQKKGEAAGRIALEHAREKIGQPVGSAIFFAVDFDASEPEVATNVTDYFKGVKATLGNDYKIGAYGSGAVINALYENGHCDYRWLSLSTGWRGYKQAVDQGMYDLLQRHETQLCSLSVDSNVLNPVSDGIGTFQV